MQFGTVGCVYLPPTYKLTVQGWVEFAKGQNRVQARTSNTCEKMNFANRVGEIHKINVDFEPEDLHNSTVYNS